MWCAFVVVHVIIVLVANRSGEGFYGDPHLYARWILGGLHFGEWPVLTQDSVYPLGALIPMTLPALVAPNWSPDYEGYRVAYELLVVAMNGLAVGTLLRAERGSTDSASDGSTGSTWPTTLGAWWWLLFLLCLGPISLTRLDGFSAALTVIALAQLLGSRAHPDGRRGLAAGLATLGAWIKIAPGAAWLAMAITAKRPWREAIRPALLVTAALLVPAGIAILATGDGIGGLGRLTSFLGEQGGRGLQSESGGATFFSVARLWNSGHVIEYNKEINTWEIVGPGTAAMSTALGFLLIVAVAVAGFATWRAVRRIRLAIPDETAQRIPVLELTLFAAAALSMLLVAFNKVGSPQFIAWFGPAVAVALTALRPTDSQVSAWRSWLVLAVTLPIIGLFTQQLYPEWYGGFVNGETPAIVVGAVRNALVLIVGIWATYRLVRWRAPQVDTVPL